MTRETGRGAEGQPRAEHGYRNEVSWGGGRGRQPYTNQEEELGPATAKEYPAGNAGETAGTNIEQFDQVRGVPQTPPEREVPRKTS